MKNKLENFYFLYFDLIQKSKNYFTKWTNSIQKKWKILHTIKSYEFISTAKDTNLTLAELSRFFENENLEKSFFDSPYFHSTKDFQISKSKTKLIFEPNTGDAYIQEKFLLGEWKLKRKIFPMPNGKSGFHEIFQFTPTNFLLEFLIRIVHKPFTKKIQEFIELRIQTIDHLIFNIRPTPKKIHLFRLTAPTIHSVENSIQNIYILPFFYELKLLKKYIPKKFTPKFFGKHILVQCVLYQIQATQIEFSNGKILREIFSKSLPKKIDLYVESFPYSDEKVVGLETETIKIGSIYPNQALLKKEAEWDFSPIEITGVSVNFQPTKKSISLFIGDNFYSYIPIIENSPGDHFLEFGISKSDRVVPFAFSNSENPFLGHYISSGLKKEKV
ncbi:MAG: hypothetical protein L6Q54_04335 [Leptospiraceae bacterium]|nr:hypothetical protein [Leptospiraceae bacterium]MCK6380463.1 hypothetical protein [Leptospiraceae bacterium]